MYVASVHPVFPLLTSIQFPETATFLTEAERHYVIELMKTDSQGLATHYKFEFVLQALKDYKIYLLFIVYIGYVNKGTFLHPNHIPDIYLAQLCYPRLCNRTFRAHHHQ